MFIDYEKKIYEANFHLKKLDLKVSSYVLNHAKKDKMVSCGAPGCTNQSGKNSNTITLVTTITLLQLYRSISRTLAYLIPDKYFKACQISKMMKHIENHAIVTTVYSGIFKHTQGFCNIQPCPGILRDIKVYCCHSGFIETY